MSYENQIIKGTKSNWFLPSYEKSFLWELSKAFQFSLPILQVLVNRGFNTTNLISDFLFTDALKVVSDPILLEDAEKAAYRIISAIKNKEKILICGDYDVDGITSSAMMMSCLLPLGANVNYFLPHRVNDGYGLSSKTVAKAAANGYKLLITVDNGITCFEAALEAKKHNIDLIITDHHKPKELLPEAFAIINPHRNDCKYPFKKFAGVGVGFKLLTLIYEILKKEKMPTKIYELMLLGTVADVVPLTGENRYWVRQALSIVNKFDSLSLQVLKQNANFSKEKLSSTDIGFLIAPQLNALGRLQDARQGVRFLLAQDEAEVYKVGAILKELNNTRKEVEAKVVFDIKSKINSGEVDINKERIIFAGSTNWSPGVVGLAASRIVAEYLRPALVFHITNDGLAKGSCRSIKNFDMFKALSQCSDLLLTFGGHPMAAGFSLLLDNLSLFKDRLESIAEQEIPIIESRQAHNIDAEIDLFELDKKLISDLEYLEPFGNENTQPLFLFSNISLVGTPILLKDAHVKCNFFKDGVIRPAIFFNRPELYDLLQSNKEKSMSIIGYAYQNEWNSRKSFEIQAVDITF